MSALDALTHVDMMIIGVGVVFALLALWWFGASLSTELPDDRQIHWQFDTFEWFLRELNPHPQFDDESLIRPDPEVFSVDGRGDALAEELFEQVRDYAGMADWPCRLEPRGLAPGEQEVHEYIVVQRGERAAGTFEADDEGEVTISYGVELVEYPMELVAVFAHELAHYLMHASVEQPPPGGWDAEEPATDLCAIYMGFGIFQANAAFQFGRGDDVFVSSSEARFTGYLNELELAYGLAIFTAVHELDPGRVARYLDGNPRAYFRDAYSDVTDRHTARIDELRELL